MAGGMPRCRFEPDTLYDHVVRIDQVCEARFDDRLDRVFIYRSSVSRLVDPYAGNLCLREKVAGVGEGRHPFTVDKHGIPPAMVDMQVRAHDKVDALSREPGTFQPREELSVKHVQHRMTSRLIIAYAGIHHDPLAVSLDDEGLEVQDDIAVICGKGRA